MENKDILKLWENDPQKEITIQELLSKINSEIEASSASVEFYIRTLFQNNQEAKSKLIVSPYWSLPEFKYKNG